MIKVRNLTKRFHKSAAVDNLSFDVGHGETVGFLGPNGAGKTTTMQILAGFLAPTSGSATVAGFDVVRDSLDVRRRIGYLPENAPLYLEMRVHEYLRYRGRLKGLRGKSLRRRMRDVIDQCEIRDAERSIIGQLSRGFRQRVGLADTLLHEPEILILDEPTMGLDPGRVRRVRELIGEERGRRTILLSSHVLSEVEMMCERVLILDNGRIVASNTTEKLAAEMAGNRRIIMEIKGGYEEILGGLMALTGIVRVEGEAGSEWHRFALECEKGEDVRPQLSRTIAEKGWSLREMREEKARLEDIFLSLTGSASSPGAGGKDLETVFIPDVGENESVSGTKERG